MPCQDTLALSTLHTKPDTFANCVHLDKTIRSHLVRIYIICHWIAWGGGGEGEGGQMDFFLPQKGSHVDKQFCLYVRLDGLLGRAAASWGPSPCGPQVSIVRAPADGPHPRLPWGSERKKNEALTWTRKLSDLSGALHPFCLADTTMS